MKHICPWFAALLFLLFWSSEGFGQTPKPQPSLTPLRNGDILRMHRAGVKPGEIVARIVTSPCHFDTFPQVLRELKMKGLPQTVIMAMTMVPYGPPASALEAVPPPLPPPPTVKVQIPAGTVVHVENVAAVSSANLSEGALINLRVSRRVLVNGVLVIERGAPARGRVVRSTRARGWGRAGALDWRLEDVLAVDGSVVPIKMSQRLKGNGRSAAVVTAAIVTGAVVFPYTPPMGLIWAFKKGDEAVLEGEAKSAAVVGSQVEVVGKLPAPKRVIFHSVEQLKATAPAKTGGLPPMSQSFKASSIRRN